MWANTAELLGGDLRGPTAIHQSLPALVQAQGDDPRERQEAFALTVSQDNVLVLWNAVSFLGRMKIRQKKIPRDGRSRIKIRAWRSIPYVSDVPSITSQVKLGNGFEFPKRPLGDQIEHNHYMRSLPNSD